MSERPTDLVGPLADQPYPTRRELLDEAAPSKAARGLRATFVDTYTTLLQVGIAFLLLLGGSAGLRNALRAGLSTSGNGPGWVAQTSAVLTAVGLSLAFTAFGLAVWCRLGPVSLGTAPTTWWTPLPVDRGRLLRPVVRNRALGSALAGGLFSAWATSVAFGVAGQLSGALVAGGLLGGFAVGAGLAGLGFLLVVRPAVGAGVPALLRASRVLDAVGVALVVALAASAVVGISLDAVQPRQVLVPALVVGLGALVGLVLLARPTARRAGDVPSPSLRRGASRLERLTSSVLQFDVREMGRALSADSDGRVARRRRFPRVHGPVAAIVAADVTLLRRQPRRLVTAGVLALVPFVLAAGTSAHRAVAALLLWLAGYAAATTLSEPARGLALVPAAARTLPIAASTVVIVRWIPVAVLSALWGALAYPLAVTTSGLLHGESIGSSWWTWALLGALAGPGFAAAALRGAVRPDPDLSAPVIATAMGSLPPGAAAATTTGPDLAVLVSVPVLLAVLARGAFDWLVLGQLLASAAAVGIGWAYAAHRARKIS
ncbi:DUF6297 family protein [Kineococcus rhizosphaerae]|uniref:ABC-2 type transport system permease protein n=1 Tax=Kineococcus rhizosphaerae TaxID=559628 RepID=A0A2T0R891_9ACTN|nr:DUF6297 family protein [Kineococcus rhizosphaerae]PRY17376.1 hypothetical protein CLV37_102339 [Kineococcus rhizosphaerae]